VSPKLRRILVPGLFALVGLVVLLGLGTWQIERKLWKEALIATLSERLTAPPEPLPPAASWPSLDRSEHEFRRVAFRAEFLPGKTPQQRDRETRLFTSGSALREDVKAPGYFVFAPARLADGRLVVVDRGYVQNERPTADTPLVERPEGPQEIVGVIRWPEEPGLFANDYSRYDDLWFVRDPAAMAQRNGWGAVAPFYIVQEAPVPTGGVPRPGGLTIKLRNDHLQYALTWYGLALVLLAVFAFWARGRLKEK